jgi:hypothetical protein
MATPNNEKPIIVAFTLDFETGGGGGVAVWTAKIAHVPRLQSMQYV